MHRCCVLLVTTLVGAGCAGTPEKKEASGKPAQGQPNTPPIIEPVSAFSGKVVLVNVTLKYIVVEGVIGRLPPAEQPLNIYRDGQKVGVAVVSAQVRGANFAADLTQGEGRVGDTVRSD